MRSRVLPGLASALDDRRSTFGFVASVFTVIVTLAAVATNACTPAADPVASQTAAGARTAAGATAATVIRPVVETAALPHDADDPAIWLHPTDPGRSLILATDKIAEKGGLYVFGLDGKLRQTLAPLDRPNNVDVEYGVTLGSRQVDIAVVTERKQHRLRVYAIPADGGALVDLAPAGIPVLAGQAGEASEPMGVALYKRPRDGATFALVAPKTGATADYLWQYRLEADAAGAPTGTLVRRFGAFSRRGATPLEIGEIEAVVVDDELGYVYYSDERFGIRKWQADPEHADAGRELAVFGREGYAGDREGLAIYAPMTTGRTDGSSAAAGPASATAGGANAPSSKQGLDDDVTRGFIVSSDQVEGGTRVWLYPRAGTPGNPHDHRPVAMIATMADETDGLDVTARPLPGFPRGLLVMMNSGKRNFQFYRWEDLEAQAARQPAGR